MSDQMERELVLKAQHGDEGAFALIAAEVGPRLHDVAYRMLRNRMHAEDATQEALVDIWRNLPSLRDPDRFGGWSYRILVRRCYAESRRVRRQVAEIVQPLTTTPDTAEQIADRDQLERAFGQLSIEQRAVIILRHHVGLSTADTSDVLGVPQETVRTRLRRGLKAMRAGLDADARATAGPGSRTETVR